MDSFQFKKTVLVTLKIVLGTALRTSEFALNQNYDLCSRYRLTPFINHFAVKIERVIF